MKKLLLILPIAILLTGCGVWERGAAGIMGHSKICVGGVLYLQFTSGATVAYNPDGTIKRC